MLNRDISLTVGWKLSSGLDHDVSVTVSTGWYTASCQYSKFLLLRTVSQKLNIILDLGHVLDKWPVEKPGDEEPLSINRSLSVAINSSGENGFTGFSLKVPCTRVLPTSEGQAHVFLSFWSTVSHFLNRVVDRVHPKRFWKGHCSLD